LPGVRGGTMLDDPSRRDALGGLIDDLVKQSRGFPGLTNRAAAFAAWARHTVETKALERTLGDYT